MSVSKLSAGTGYRYLLQHIARGDTDEAVGRAGSLTAYYAESGYPPGIWLGRGLEGLGGGTGVAPGSVVSEKQMARLFGAGHDPVTDQPLGRPYSTAGGGRVPVAGFDLTFSPAKSVSVLWALADERTRGVIVAAHHEAIAQTLAVIERDVARTRAGHAGAAVLPVRGLVAAGFDHYDSRAGDPQLHTHVTVANRVQGPDGNWRTLHAAELYRATVAMSATYDALLNDHVTRRLGLAWQTRPRGRGRNPAHELAAVPPALIAEFSQRSAVIDDAGSRAIAEFAAAHGRAPTAAEVAAIRQHATLQTRQAKHTRPLADYTAGWRTRAARILQTDPDAWVHRILGRRTPHTDAQVETPWPGRSAAAAAPSTATVPVPRLLSAAEVTDDAITTVAAAVVAATEHKRSTWSRWNLTAETARQVRDQGWQFATARDLLTVQDRIVARAVGESVSLDAPELADVPQPWRDPTTGRSAFAGPETFTSHAVLDAETRLLDAADDLSAPTAPTTHRATGGTDSPERAAAVEAICRSGRTLDLLIGPAGTGKTAAVNDIVERWRTEHGSRSVLMLAVSAAAAQVLATATNTRAETAAMWLTRHQREDADLARLAQLQRLGGRELRTGKLSPALDAEAHRLQEQFQNRLRPGSLIVLDEAGMADVHTLDRLTTAARHAGAKLLLVGDDHQLSPVGPGGSLGMLAHHRPDAPHLSNVQRYRDPDGTIRTWEAHASAQLRLGNPEALAAYTEHDRIRGGHHDAMLEAAYHAWRHDTETGVVSLLLAHDNDTVTALNRRAQTDRTRTGHVQPDGVALDDGTYAGVGDKIITRRNDRSLHPSAGAANSDHDVRHRDPHGPFVSNGQQFTITATHPDASLTAVDPHGRTVTLPADYVAHHVQLGYAATIHRAQGATVDTAHVIAAPGMTREALYVALTRGRTTNTAYAITSQEPPGNVDHLGPAQPRDTAVGALAKILACDGADNSAHTALRQTWDQAGSRRQILAEYRQIAETAHRQRTLALLDRAGPVFTPAESSPGAPSAGEVQIHRLTTAIRAGDAYGLNAEQLLPALARRCDNLDQLVERYEHHAADAHSAGRGRPVVRTLPDGKPTATTGITDPDIRRALLQREELLQRTKIQTPQRPSPHQADHGIHHTPPSPTHHIGIGR